MGHFTHKQSQISLCIAAIFIKMRGTDLNYQFFDMKKLLAIALLFSLSAPLLAETRYVSDELTVYARSGPGTKYKILRGLKSGRALEVVGAESDGWLPVRIGADQKGYVLSHQIQRSPVAKDLLAAAQAERDKLRKKVAALNEQLSSSTSVGREKNAAHAKLLGEYDALQARFQKLERTSSRAVEIEAENSRYANEIATVEAERDRLRLEVGQLRGSSNRDWFVAGAGIILLGMLLGLVIPKIRWQRKDSWSQL